MADGDRPLHAAQRFLVKDLVHQAQVLDKRDQIVVVYGDAAGLLAAVLQGVERVIDGLRRVHARRVPVVNAENAAFLVKFFQVASSSFAFHAL